MNSSADKTVYIIAGPTAVGKTAVAIRWAQHFNTEIISADSRQCFRELNIGVARPTTEELATVPHHFIATHSIHEDVNAGTFEFYALEKLEELFQEHDVVIMAGGTGLYLRAFCEGMDNMPVVDPAIRARIQETYATKGLLWLQEEIKKKDPDFYKTGEMKNPQRMMRALEIVESAEKSILSFRTGRRSPRPFRVKKIGLALPKEILDERISARVDRMIENGLVEEVKELLPFRDRNALQTVGYAEIFDYLDGKLSLEEAINQVRIHTRQYAKRQMTWFRKDAEYEWHSPEEAEKMLEKL